MTQKLNCLVLKELLLNRKYFVCCKPTKTMVFKNIYKDVIKIFQAIEEITTIMS